VKKSLGIRKLATRARGFVFSRLLRGKASKVGAAIVLVFIIVILVGPYFLKYGPNDTDPSAINSPPSPAHPFGTDFLGHDVLSQVIYGAYPSLIVALVASICAIFLGLFVGVIAGYFKHLEAPLSGTADIVLTFPPLPLMILLGSLYPATNTLIILILIVILWPIVARAIRSQVLSIKERPYVESAQLSGMRSWEIIYRVVIPEVAPIAIAYFVLYVAASIVLVTALEFLGVGNPSIVSWGSILYWAQQFAFYAGDWWWIVAPGFAITTVATAFALIGFSVEEVMNPRLRA
jgi:peptide/nickel transport system permease protein